MVYLFTLLFTLFFTIFRNFQRFPNAFQQVQESHESFHPGPVMDSLHEWYAPSPAPNFMIVAMAKKLSQSKQQNGVRFGANFNRFSMDWFAGKSRVTIDQTPWRFPGKIAP